MGCSFSKANENENEHGYGSEGDIPLPRVGSGGLRVVKSRTSCRNIRPLCLAANGPGNRNTTPDMWGMTVSQWCVFVTACQDDSDWEAACSTPERGKTEPKNYGNLYDLNVLFVKPWTRRTGNSVALLMNSCRPLSAQLFLSHTWSADIGQTMDALTAWVRVHALPATAVVWFCLFANYQPGSEPGDCGPTLADQISLDPFATVIKVVRMHLGMLVLHTSVAELYDRRWCVFEVDTAIGGNVPIYAAGSSHFVRKACELDDVKTLEVDTEKSKCSSPKDFENISREVLKKGGFQRLNDEITQFRLTMVLNMKVEEGEASFCKQLLVALANPNQANVMGRVCLHAAARNADCDTVETLLHHKADPLACDLHGDCPAHLLPLQMEAHTTPLFAMLAASDEVLAICNNAGMSVFRRFADWAMGANDGSPYLPAQAHVDHLMDVFASTTLDPSTYLRRHSIAARVRASTCYERESTTSQILTRQQNGEWDLTSVFCTGALEGNVGASQAYVCTPSVDQVDILFLAWGGRFAIPWPLQRHAIERICVSMCMQYNAKVTVLTFSSVPVLATATHHDFTEQLCSAIQALPLRERFVVIDDTMGLATAALWRFQSRLMGACIINFSNFWSDEYMQSDSHKSVQKLCSQCSDTLRSRDLEAAAKMVSNATFTPLEEDKEARLYEMEAALTCVDEAWWIFGAGAVMWRVSQLTEAMRHLLPLCDLPVRLLCGDHAMKNSTHEASMRLKSSLIPQAKVETIRNSGYWWQVEGEKQVTAVIAVLDDLFSCISTLSTIGTPSLGSGAPEIQRPYTSVYPIRYSL